MKTLKILDWPEKRFYSETHPFYRWTKQFRDHGIKIEFYDHHQNKGLKDADYVFLHSRYFDKGKNVNNNGREDDEVLIKYLTNLKESCGKLIWFDASDSTGSSDFSIIPHIDVFLKKQILKDKSAYNQQKPNNLRVWINPDENESQHHFKPCPANQLHKIKLGWNLGLNDYRYFGYKLSRLSNYLSYNLYPLKFTKATQNRTLDLTFRGTIHRGMEGKNSIAEQRNQTFKLLEKSKMNVASGAAIPKNKYWKELRNSKLSISPYGWGEICYRDFETLIAGALLIKPSMEHLITYPNVFIPYETYMPVSWDLKDLQEKLDQINSNYSQFNQIAINGQQMYKKVLNDSDAFIHTILKAIV